MKYDVYTYKLGSWVNDVAFSKDGKYSFAIGHDASFLVVDNKSLTEKVSYYSHHLCKDIIIVDEKSIILIGFDRHFYKYELDSEGNWKYTKTITLEKKKEAPQVSQTNQPSNVQSEKKDSIFNRMQLFDKSHQLKKSSILATTFGSVPELGGLMVHKTNIVNFQLNNNKLITADFAGFIKTWEI